MELGLILLFSMRNAFGYKTNDSIKPLNQFLLLHQQRIIKWQYDGSDIKLTTGNDLDMAAKVRTMTSGDLKCLFQNKKLVQKFFPHNMLFNRYMGYKVQESNIPFLVMPEVCAVYATLKSEVTSSDDLPKDRNFSDAMIDEIDLVSCELSHISMQGMVYSCDIYSSSDLSSLMSHLLRHVQRIKSVTNEKRGFLMLTHNGGMTENDFVPVLNKCGIVEHIPGAETHRVWYEKQMNA